MGLKELDFFRKLSHDNVTKPTLLGSLLSISAISLMIYLLLRQLIDFYSPHSFTDAVVEQPDNPDQTIKINLDLLFSSIPCHILSLDTVDVMRNHKSNIEDTIKKYRIFNNSSSPVLFPSSSSSDFSAAVKAIEDHEGCRLRGFIPILAVPGEFHVSFHGYRGIINTLRLHRPDLLPTLHLSHSFSHLSFSSKPQKNFFNFFSGISNFFGRGKNFEGEKFFGGEKFFKGEKNENKENEEKIMNYYYFVKVIPNIIIDDNYSSKSYSFSFSLSKKLSEFRPEAEDMQTLSVQYEFSGVYMKITHSKRDYLHFVTHVSAIIGGIFVVFSVLNSLCTNLWEK